MFTILYLDPESGDIFAEEVVETWAEVAALQAEFGNLVEIRL